LAEEERDGYRVVRVGRATASRSLLAQAGYSLRAVRRIARDHRDRPFDLVHGHVYQGTVVSCLAGRRLGLPSVGTVHGLHQGQPDALRADARVASATRLERLALRFRQTAWITVGPADAATLASWGVPRERITVLGNGVDTERFQPAPAAGRPPARPPTVGFVGRLAAVKGLGTAVQALALVRRDVPDARLVLVGDGPEQARLEAEARRLGLASAVEVRTGVPFARAHEAYQAFDVFLLPSLTEGQGIVLLEAMASGLPVVSTRVGGAPALVQDGVTGHLVEVGDAAAMARALVPLLLDANRREAAGRAGRARIEQGHSWGEVAAATVGWYRKAIAWGTGARRRSGGT
jgi:phenylacetate-CoA ligase